jgi:hypothetical protein
MQNFVLRGKAQEQGKWKKGSLGTRDILLNEKLSEDA